MGTREYKPNRLTTRIASLYRRLVPPQQRETVAGATDLQADIYDFTLTISQNRVGVYRDIKNMDDVSPEASRALDVLADNAVNSPNGTLKTFTVRFDEGEPVPPETQKIILDMLARTHVDDNIYTIGRSALAMGDEFQQILVGEDGRISGLVRMPPETMVRNIDNTGRLKTGRKKGEWAFEQYTDGGATFVAGFFPWQIEHVRWNKPGWSKYGRSALHTARYPFKKLQAMEEALVINWLTRAFARLLFQLDTTGMSRVEAQQYLKAFMDQLSRRTISEDSIGTERLSVAKDLAIGNSWENLGGKWEQTQNDVKVLDTSNTGFWNISAVEYWRNKLMIATGVPKAHLNVEEDVNSRCLGLETRIPLLRGDVLTLREIIAEFETTGKAPWVYSWDAKTGKIVPGKISWAGITRRNAQVVDVVLDDKTAIRATPDHRFYQLSGDAVEAQHLRDGQQLIALKTHLGTGKNSFGYLKAKDPFGKVFLVHRRVAKTLWPNEYVQGIHAHHIDRNKLNNDPNNLSLLTDWEHLQEHRHERDLASAAYYEKHGTWNQGLHRGDGNPLSEKLPKPTYIEKLCANPDCNNTFVVPLTKKKKRFCSKSCGAQNSSRKRAEPFRRDATCAYCGKSFVSTAYILSIGGGQFCSAECRVAGLRERKRKDLVCEYCGEKFSVYTKRGYGRRFCSKKCSNTYRNKLRAGLIPVPNHQVTRILPVDKREDTGDITVDGWHNFFVADASGGGVLVHNSTLQWQDERFSRTVRRVQMMLSGFLHHLIDLELTLHGIQPETVNYVVEWPTPSTQDEGERANTLLQKAQAAEIMLRNGVVDVEHVQEHWLNISPAQRQRINQETSNGREGAGRAEEE